MAHWVINANIATEPGYAKLVQALERMFIPYTIVVKPPFVDYLIKPDRQFGDDIEKITLNIDGPVFVSGTTSMKDVSKNHGWNPGYIEGVDQDALLDIWNHHMLNYGCVIAPFRSAIPNRETFFVRPVNDTKSFSGQVMTYPEFASWRELVLNHEQNLANITGDDLIMMAPLQKIYAEWRLIFVEEEYITGSLYKTGDTVRYSEDVPSTVVEFATARLKSYNPRPVSCIDIANVEDEYGRSVLKVIEMNAVSSAGFYACDMNKYAGFIDSAVDALGS
jgi:hypothetical protein